MHTDDDLDTLRSRLAELQTEHRDLDAVIAHLAANSPSDDLLLRRMKKRKLQLKDKMILIERLLTPDEPA